MDVEGKDRTQPPANALYDRFLQVRRDGNLRHRDAAQALGVSEGAAVAAAVGRTGSLRAARLTGPWPELFEQLPALGAVMALTRNQTTVHEKVGRYEGMSHEGLVGLALGADIDLRIFYMHWAHAYALVEDTPRGESRSLQIFDKHGDAVHKVYLRAESDLAAWHELVESNMHDDQIPGDAFVNRSATSTATPDDEVDVGAFRDAWLAMKDTHEFFPLLRRFKLERTQALRLAPAEAAYRVDNGAARRVLEEAARSGNSIMCFVGNAGMIQIHTGRVCRVEVMGRWLNVLDRSFNLHLQEDRIAASWIVRKPTVDGEVTSLELFDETGGTMAMFFGERKPGKPELEDWRALLARIGRLAS